MHTIDGSQGEGGGQIVRTSLALSALTGQAVTITQVRAGRKRPGLLRQHVTAARAAAEICDGRLIGAELGSRCLTLSPGPVRAGDYRFSICTAGSATLVLQTVLPALLTAAGVSTVVLEGGTHNMSAPPFDFLARVYLPLIQRMGPRVEANLERYGFYPAGGGRCTVKIHPSARLEGLELLERGEIISRRVRALVSRLPLHIARRECETIARKSKWPKKCFHAEEVDNAGGPGNVVMIEIAARHVTELFTGFGRQGVRAEAVAASVWREAQRYLEAGVPVGEHLADQLLLPLGISAHTGAGGAFRTSELSPHAETHLQILPQFLNLRVDIDRTESTVTVRLHP
jgi:RNA 3'-terminal phosphate cyclase (ATP)